MFRNQTKRKPTFDLLTTVLFPFYIISLRATSGFHLLGCVQTKISLLSFFSSYQDQLAGIVVWVFLLLLSAFPTHCATKNPTNFVGDVLVVPCILALCFSLRGWTLIVQWVSRRCIQSITIIFFYPPAMCVHKTHPPCNFSFFFPPTHLPAVLNKRKLVS